MLSVWQPSTTVCISWRGAVLDSRVVGKHPSHSRGSLHRGDLWSAAGEPFAATALVAPESSLQPVWHMQLNVRCQTVCSAWGRGGILEVKYWRETLHSWRTSGPCHWRLSWVSWVHSGPSSLSPEWWRLKVYYHSTAPLRGL